MKSRLKTSHIALLATCRDRRAHQLLLWFLKQNAPSVIPAIFIALHRFCYTLYMKVRKVFFLQNFAMQCFVMCSQQFNDCQILVKPLCSRIRIYILADNITCLFLTLSRPRTNLNVLFHPLPKQKTLIQMLTMCRAIEKTCWRCWWWPFGWRWWGWGCCWCWRWWCWRWAQPSIRPADLKQVSKWLVNRRRQLMQLSIALSIWMIMAMSINETKFSGMFPTSRIKTEEIAWRLAIPTPFVQIGLSFSWIWINHQFDNARWTMDIHLKQGWLWRWWKRAAANVSVCKTHPKAN